MQMRRRHVGVTYQRVLGRSKIKVVGQLGGLMVEFLIQILAPKHALSMRRFLP